MPSRVAKTYPKDSETAYPHREHRSRKSMKGLNTRYLRERRVMKMYGQKKKEERLRKKLRELIKRI